MGTEREHNGNTVMLGLFREELAGWTRMLEAGLAEIEQGLPPERIEGLIRTVHAIKGASRLVGLPIAVNLAYAMETFLSEVRSAKCRLAARQVVSLRQACDIFRAIGGQEEQNISRWLVERESDILRISQVLGQSIPETESPPFPEIPESSVLGGESTGSAEAPIESVEQDDVTPAATDTANVYDGEISARRLEEDVSRDRFGDRDSLIALAGECLDQARRLQKLRPVLQAADHLPPAPDRGTPSPLLQAERNREEIPHTDPVLQFESSAKKLEQLAKRLYDEILEIRKASPASSALSPVLGCLLVEIHGESYALPISQIDRVARVSPSDITSVKGRPFVSIDGENIGLIDAGDLLRMPSLPPSAGDRPVVILGDRSSRCGLVVEAFRGEEDLALTPLDRRLGKVDFIRAAAILGDGSPTLVLDMDDLHSAIEMHITCDRPAVEEKAVPASPPSKKNLSGEHLPWPFWKE